MALAGLLVVLLAGLNYEGYFGPVCCWPRDFDPHRAERILRRQDAVQAYLTLQAACDHEDTKTIRRHELSGQPLDGLRCVVQLPGIKGEYVLMAFRHHLCSGSRLHWRRVWSDWLAGHLVAGPYGVPLALDEDGASILTSTRRQGNVFQPEGADPDYILLRRIDGTWKASAFLMRYVHH